LESLDYRVDLLLDASSAQDIQEPSVELTMALSDVVDSSMTARSTSKVRQRALSNAVCLVCVSVLSGPLSTRGCCLVVSSSQW
jgi:hypothetical protein